MMELNKLLPYVQKPSRYTGGEWNVHKTSRKPKATVCLCFPDLYEIGTSSLGMEILYRAVNQKEEFVAERCYAPDLDFSALLEANGLQLFSLESKTPLKNFDLLGFTLQYELSLTNVLLMLELSGVEIFSRDRIGFPLVLGGGPLTSNPEPFADFFDAIVIGDGEEVLLEIMETVAEFKNNNRKEILKRLSAIKGVYVPSFYEPVYENGIFIRLKKNEDVPDSIEKRIFDISSGGIDLFTAPIIPNVESVHSRLNIEVARGCPHTCKFCQARSYYWPYRYRPISSLKKAVEVGLKNTGYDELAFTSLSSGDYPDISKLIAETLNANKKYPLSVSLPSLHCENFSEELAEVLSKSSSRPSLTFAPEAGSERLRFSIGKSLTDEMIFSSLSNAVSAGWKNVKLYFMYGLPGETQDDLEAIVKLVSEIKKRFRALKIKLTLSPFVPKPQTDFERVPQDTMDTLNKKLEYLRKNLKIPLSALKCHSIESAFVEGLLARADRRAGRIIYRAYKNGSRFDQWQDRFNLKYWMKAFEEEKINPYEYINRFSEASALPWAHINLKSFKKIDIKVKHPSENDSIPAIAHTRCNTQAASTIRYRIRVSRSSMARYISHNDQVNMFRRVIRRAELPVNFTNGFSPRPKISFGPAISVGYESEAEFFEVEFSRYEMPAKIFSDISRQLPEGYKILSVKQVPTFFPSIESLCNVVDYEIVLPECAVAADVIDRFNNAENLMYQKSQDSQPYDLKSVVREIKVIADDRIFISLYMQLTGRSVKPEKLMSVLLNINEKEFLVKRLRFYTIKKDGTLLEL